MNRVNIGGRAVINSAIDMAVENARGGPIGPNLNPLKDPEISRSIGEYLVKLSARRARSRNTHRHKRGRRISS